MIALGTVYVYLVYVAARRPDLALDDPNDPNSLNDNNGESILADRDDQRLVEHDPLVAGVDQCVGGTEIDREIVGKESTDTTKEHAVTSTDRPGGLCAGAAT